MSIIFKISLLFAVSLVLMIGIGYQIDSANTQKYESLMIQKYTQDGRKILGWLSTTPADKLENKLASINLEIIKDPIPKRYILRRSLTFGIFEIFESESNGYLLHIQYLGDELYLRNTTLKKESWKLNTLVAADIAVLILMYILILRMLSPLHSIVNNMRQFARGDFKSRSDVDTDDEIAEVSRSYNDMAQTIENLIRSREELLRDVGHELRTPIARGMFAVEQIDDPKIRDVLKNTFHDLDRLTKELLEIEKLDVANSIQHETFTSETLVMESLSKLHLIEESDVKVVLSENFTISGDLYYLSLALKNLLENAIKYADTLPVILQSDQDSISVINSGTRLKKDIIRLQQPFTREEESRTTDGFGLGLNIVQKILSKHGFELRYEYLDGHHIFRIVFSKRVK